jgi:hypothetical protein
MFNFTNQLTPMRKILLGGVSTASLLCLGMLTLFSAGSLGPLLATVGVVACMLGAAGSGAVAFNGLELATSQTPSPSFATAASSPIETSAFTAMPSPKAAFTRVIHTSGAPAQDYGAPAVTRSDQSPLP